MNEEPKASGLVAKTVAVLRVVAASNSIGLSAVARAVGISKATTLRILAELCAQGVVRQDERKNYRIGFAIIGLMPAQVNQTELRRAISAELRDLAQRTDETVGLDVLVGEEVVVIAQEVGSQLIAQAPKPVPRNLPTWCTSTGKVLLAGLAENEVKARHFKAVESFKKASGGNDLLMELQKVRDNGVGVARNELSDGAAAIAVPVIVEGTTEAAVWLGGPTDRLFSVPMSVHKNSLEHAAESIARIIKAYRTSQVAEGDLINVI